MQWVAHPLSYMILQPHGFVRSCDKLTTLYLPCTGPITTKQDKVVIYFGERLALIHLKHFKDVLMRGHVTNH